MILNLWRVTSAALAGFALLWAGTIVATLPPRGLLGMAQGVQLGQVYPLDEVSTVLAATSTTDCRVEVRRSALLLNMLLFDGENRGDPAAIVGKPSGSRLATARAAAEALLKCAPSESLGWLVLYLTSIRQSGFGPDAVAELSAAYRNAPHEAWLQALRLPVVLPVYHALPLPLQRMAMDDFDDLLSAGMHKAVASLIAGSPLAMKDALVARLCSSPRDQQAVVANELERLRRPIARCLSAREVPAYLR